MTEDTPHTQDAAKPHLALKAQEIMAGTWDLQGHDLATNAEIRGQYLSILHCK
ncbi:MAG TPA: hypothetical protein VFY25_15135 [Anaerolineales bacterium]|nr:hypothetical protein [Anaerolineales bacterium]